MSALALIIAIIFATYIWYQKKYRRRNELLNKIPSPKSNPFLKQAKYFINKKPVEIFNIIEQWSREYGPIWKICIPFASNIIIHDPKTVEEILSSQKILVKSMEYDFLVDWLGTGLLISSGKKWFQRRKIITPTFHFKILEQFVDVMEVNGNVLVDKLKQLQGREFDIYPLISLYGLDVICESAMGYQLNAQVDENSVYVKAVKEITQIISFRFFDPYKRSNFLYRFTSSCKREKELIKILHGFTYSVINSRRDFIESQNSNANEENTDDFGVKKKTAFLDLLLKVKIDNHALDNESIREEVDTFMFEAHDTTAASISFILFNLSKHPEIQQKVLDECKEIFGDNLNRTASMQDLNKLSYLEKVIKESLRLYPPVPHYSRKLDSEFTTSKYTFPENVTITIAPYIMGRDPNLFPDPLKFDPSRFDDEKNIKLFSFVPFSAGARNCIGQKFAMLELKSAISKIVRNFEIYESNIKPEIYSQVTLASTTGVHLTLKERK